jgi:hypothetical protein
LELWELGVIGNWGSVFKILQMTTTAPHQARQRN